MKIIHSIFDFKSTQKTIVTIGTFDGVHIGHQKIIRELVAEAKTSGKKSVLLTFFPHPRMVLQKDVTIKLINTIDERAAYLEKLGLDYLIIHPFSKEFSRLTALDFVRTILVNQFNTSKLIIGYDHHFGKNREGNIAQLTEYSHLYNFTVEEIPAQDIDQVSVSSTKIRKNLADGHLKTANNYLGTPFSLSGKVVKGKQLGRKIGFPTANIEIPESYKLIPKTGVYIVKSTIENKSIFGMMNIGNRPTVNGKNQSIEVHFFDFKADLYHQNITVELLYFLRNEQKFDSLNDLVIQLEKDKDISLEYLKNNK
ncbi:bifunctional riboflavin kinase/FAD synthetase [Tenacibaculum finnmarkense]|uniref:bifunctional riboflavin kinase/FAD synthetase n=1 Tax=Tenacibaculum finnmarkense TaxID=2781243 RepID=UPI001E44CB3F|nr:bifunctional riboflavin kinase/FAD synthetase [Tenacibaculum finnmarkense]MCD8402201.1 bifunctional riboflavin kinase/FAD synthetase [Tenacibaculum finnmarkense genomovar finnmarkense]MCD8446468.1 bifunctional riboflavin kinase/FAD synthetase [Tenacibaculum finnmarkense genomovar finnmarkense]MCD8453492.1 bifunctional riboflavin kinase/FAD synthetase [Tenacibaculum finnmarkense genomovar ulcerans]MCG8805059.1 bifunctional riboflavin kinase/FAD synthetase [Tenacibaculum finnmarkense]MCG88555